MLVGCGMKYEGRMVFGENVSHSFAIAKIGDAENELRSFLLRLELHLQVEDPGFVPVQAHEVRGIELQDLAAQFRSDCSSGASHQNSSPFDLLSDRLQVDLYRIPSEQILQFDIMD